MNWLVAQGHKNHENFKAHKTAYITQSLDLSSKEAEKFWPVYNAYEKKAFNLRVSKNREIRKQIKENGGIDAMDDKLVNEYLNTLLQNEQAYIDLKRKLYNDLKNVLPSKKMLKLYKTEGEFNRKVLSEFRKNKHKKTE